MLTLRAALDHQHLLRWLCVALLLIGCGSGEVDDNKAPVLGPLSDQVVSVNQPLSFSLLGSDPEGAQLSFSLSTDAEGITRRATLTPAGSDAAVFSWTPLATDIGTHVVGFTVSDGSKSDSRAVTIEVKSSVGNGVPVFRKPLGTGTTLDLATRKCAEVQVEVEDPDSPGVTIEEVEPKIAGAELIQDSGLTATWQWCPSPAQVQAADVHTLRLSADDGDNPKVSKNFVIVLRKPQKANCPGEAPVIVHTPSDVSGIHDIKITAQVSDDLGIKGEPLLLYSTSDPGSPADLSKMTQVSLVKQSGSQQAGEWRGSIPNPVATAPSGTRADVYYILVARDDDDPAADCDHLTQSPPSGSHHISVTSAAGGGGLALCEPCSADAQCGAANDLCVQLGGAGRCFVACGAGDVCPSGYTCSASALTSESGATARQCVPSSQSCTGPVASCEDDAYEENDSLSAAKNLPMGDELLVSCPKGDSDDEDWFALDVGSEGRLSVELLGGTETDLDLALYDAGGALIARSSKLSSEELVSACVAPGKYYARVYAYDLGRNEYILSWSVSPESCGPACSDDGAEPDDDASHARLTDLDSGAYTSDTNAICAYDEDWYRVDLFDGETLHVALSFEQASPQEDLDILLYRGSTLLTQCTELDVSGCTDNGQSSTSNERLSYAVTTTGAHYVVVRGFDGASNLYDICIGLAANECP